MEVKAMSGIFRHILVLILLCLVNISCRALQAEITRWDSATNERPIIGILAQEYWDTDDPDDSYIAASYVKFVEAGGVQVVPFKLGQPNNTYQELLNSINGALYPGGDVSITDSMYAHVGSYIFQYAKQANDRGDYFPIWATCLGFEMLASLLVDGKTVLTDCAAHDIALPLNFTADATNGRLFGNLPADIDRALRTENVTGNYHTKCVTPDTAKSSGLDQLIKVLSTNRDSNGLEFISTFEVIGYPFYGVQWHPEKAPWEWNTDEVNLPHSPDAIAVTQYFTSFLANEARKSQHAYLDPKKEATDVIYNYNPFYSGNNGSDFEQVYIFTNGQL